MTCKCGGEAFVRDSRCVDAKQAGTYIRRRRQCAACGARWTTHQTWQGDEHVVVPVIGRPRASAAAVVVGLAMALMAAGCTSSTEYGECVGVGDDRDPALVYDTDVGNVVLAVVFFETVFVPLVVILSETSCPVAKRAKAVQP